MIQEENKDRRSPSEKERGVAEHEKANYSQSDSTKQDKGQREDHSTIKETDDNKKKDDKGGDLAGNASGNNDAD